MQVSRFSFAYDVHTPVGVFAETKDIKVTWSQSNALLMGDIILLLFLSEFLSLFFIFLLLLFTIVHDYSILEFLSIQKI